MIYFVLVDYFCLSVYFWSGESNCKDSANERNEKEIRSFLFHFRMQPIL